MAGADVTAISTGRSFLATSCFTTLIGLAVMTFPRDDRSRPREAMPMQRRVGMFAG